MKKQLESRAILEWWNMGHKTLSYDGDLKGLLKNQKITYSKRKTENEGLYNFIFRNKNGITYKRRTTIDAFAYHAKIFIQMELVRMGDKSSLYVETFFRPTVTVNH